MSTEAISATIIGKVQGVWFRKFTKKKAQQYHITGWVKNTPEGHVAIYAVGKKEKIDNFIKAIHQGPPLARIDQVKLDYTDVDIHNEFTIR